MWKLLLRPLFFSARGFLYLPASIKRPLVRAIFAAFVLLAGVLVAGTPSYASWWGNEGGGQNVDPHDVDAPPGMQYYVRQVPVVLYEQEAVKFDTEKSEYYLDRATFVWGELWSKDEWVKPDTRFGLNELYIPYNPYMQLAAASGEKIVAVAVDPKALETAETRNLWAGLVKIYDKDMVWGKDSAPAMRMEVPLPSKEAFFQQGVGVNQELAQKYEGWLGAPVVSSTGRQYYRALNAYDHGAIYYYSIFLNPGPTQSVNYDIAATIEPYYDERTPQGKGFYRGREWSTQLGQKDPGAVPGMIGGVWGWCNLKLAGPTEVTGVPGEEKELTFEVTGETRADVTTQVGIKKEGEQHYQISVDGLKVPAWGKVPASLKFRVEGQPYTVRVKVNPDETILEDNYADNSVDVVVKPIAPDMYVKVLDPGTSEAEPGKKYTGTVVFGLAADYPVPVKAALSVTNNGWAAPLADGSGRYFDETWLEEFKPGEEKAFNFTWTGDAAGNTLVAKVHPATPPDDRDWSNNSQEVYVPPAGCDVAVTAWAFNPSVDIPWDGGTFRNGANIRVTRKDGGTDPVDVVVTVDGPAGRAAYTVTLAGGEAKSVGPYRFTVSGEGEYWVHVEAWPASVRDVNPSDNVADVVVKARRLPPPETGPREPGLHAELGS